jgi:tetratricopeptide (TPR) repeat protein
MKRLILFALVAGLISCGDSPQAEVSVADDKEMLLERIHTCEANALSGEVKIDKVKGHELLRSYLDYANAYRDDSIAAVYLFKAGDVARNLGRYKQAISILTNLHDGFPKHSKKAETAFLIGFIYDNDLNDREMAKKAYEDVIELYPTHTLARDAQARIQTLYMTDEEMIKMFQQKNAPNS